MSKALQRRILKQEIRRGQAILTKNERPASVIVDFLIEGGTIATEDRESEIARVMHAMESTDSKELSPAMKEFFDRELNS